MTKHLTLTFGREESMKKFSVIALAASAFALAAAPQIASAIAVTNGNASFFISNTGFNGTSIFDSAFGNANLTTDTGASDYLSAYSWYFRTPTNNRAQQIGNNNTASSVTGANGVITVVYTNAGAGTVDRFDATIRTQLVDGATPGNATVFTTFTVTSRSGSATVPSNLNFFWLHDMDIPGTNANNGPQDAITATLSATGVTGTFTDITSSNFSTFDAPGASRLEIATASTLRGTGRLGGGGGGTQGASGYNLPTTALGTYTSSSLLDAAIATQWVLPLVNGQSTTFQTAFRINGVAAVPEPTALAAMAPLGLMFGRRRRA